MDYLNNKNDLLSKREGLSYEDFEYQLNYLNKQFHVQSVQAFSVMLIDEDARKFIQSAINATNFSIR